MVETIP